MVLVVFSHRFERAWKKVLKESDLMALVNDLIKKPDAGKVIPGSQGMRKLRWAASGRGKRGGARVIYYWWTKAGRILLMDFYTKNEKDDLSTDDIEKLTKEIVQ